MELILNFVAVVGLTGPIVMTVVGGIIGAAMGVLLVTGAVFGPQISAGDSK